MGVERTGLFLPHVSSNEPFEHGVDSRPEKKRRPTFGLVTVDVVELEGQRTGFESGKLGVAEALGGGRCRDHLSIQSVSRDCLGTINVSFFAFFLSADSEKAS